MRAAVESYARRIRRDVLPVPGKGRHAGEGKRLLLFCSRCGLSLPCFSPQGLSLKPEKYPLCSVCPLLVSHCLNCCPLSLGVRTASCTSRRLPTAHPPDHLCKTPTQAIQAAPTAMNICNSFGKRLSGRFKLHEAVEQGGACCAVVCCSCAWGAVRSQLRDGSTACSLSSSTHNHSACSSNSSSSRGSLPLSRAFHSRVLCCRVLPPCICCVDPLAPSSSSNSSSRACRLHVHTHPANLRTFKPGRCAASIHHQRHRADLHATTTASATAAAAACCW